MMTVSDNEKRVPHEGSAKTVLTIDTNFKMYSDAHDKKDPDTYSRTLRDYHLLLWSKQLPNGKMFNLTARQTPPYHLHHNSDLGDFRLASDSIIHTYSRWKRAPIAEIVSTISPTDINTFFDLACTVGSYIVFPANKVDGKPTINGIRGINSQIHDRFDFTLECIRRWYSGTESPISTHLDRYRDFFDLFEDFRGYFRFFLLDDLIDTDSGSIRFWLPFEDFGKTNPLPANVVEYREYMEKVSAFVNARNFRIAEWARLNCREE